LLLSFSWQSHPSDECPSLGTVGVSRNRGNPVEALGTMAMFRYGEISSGKEKLQAREPGHFFEWLSRIYRY
jgi:hypothetical protein